jgi:hypothetical protein
MQCPACGLQPYHSRIWSDVFFVLCLLFVGGPSAVRFFVNITVESHRTGRIYISHTGGVLSLLDDSCSKVGRVNYISEYNS